ncbi:glycosyltransferase family 2 protein [Solirubrobacter soli]|uniref:glycosyltransferase family 2 protein n=1 Tax=Solirubrobacter soli TaxID=363832 RepID=UPI000417D564|nr:glycosyltransferase [Solirubrobacter soli]
MIGDAVEFVLSTLNWVILGYFFLVNGVLAALLVSAAIEMRAHRLNVWRENRWRVLSSEVTPTISMLAPAYNEARTVSESVRSLLTLRYPSLEIVLINDGSSDATLEVLKRDFDLVPVHAAPVQRRLEAAPIRGVYRSRRTPALVVVDKENGGKADALNVGLDVAGGELVCAIDSDTLVEADALQRMIRPFLVDDDVLAVGGTIRAVNGCEVRSGRVIHERAPRKPLEAMQAVEYLRAFIAGRLGWNRLGGNLVISGAFGLFRREPMIASGGYLHETVGEDMEVVVRMRRQAREEKRGDRVLFVPDPVAWTEVPSKLKILARQRDRWHRGLADVLRRHLKLTFNPRYGALGLVAFPYFLLVELLAPVVELVGVIAVVLGLLLGVVNVEFAILFVILAYGFSVALTAFTLALEQWTYRGYGRLGDRLWLLGISLFEGLGYRQLTAVWRFKGLLKYTRGSREWGVMTREGFAGTVSSEEMQTEERADAPAR